MIAAGLRGVEYVACNTDLQALRLAGAPLKLQIGSRLTKGLGAGADPDVGRNAALEDQEKLAQVVKGADMVFLAAGLGGGTGSGAGPIIAKLAAEAGALTVAVVTKPFDFEGKKRMRQAERAARELRDHVDTLITIPNQRLLSFVEQNTPLERGLQDRRRRAAAGDPGHLGPDQLPGRDQPRLRRRQEDHVRHGPRPDGHGDRRGGEPRRPRRTGGDQLAAARGRVDRGGARRSS